METINDINILSAYWEINHNIKDYGSDLDNYPKPIKKILETDKAVKPKHLSHELFKTLLIRQCKKIEPAFVVDTHVEPLLDSITQYYREDPQFLTINPGFSFAKGLIIKGTTGTGKTTLMVALSNLMKHMRIVHPYDHWIVYYDQSFKIERSYILSQKFSMNGFAFIESVTSSIEYVSDNICIDDLGSEQLGSYYGQTSNVIEQIILLRYDKLKANRKQMLITHVPQQT